jgi:hypothetical protein
MKNVVLISKGGAVKSEKIKTFKLADIYKKCKFRKKDDFSLRHTWNYKNNWFSVFAKDKGRSNSENKYDLPPPIDTQLYFGNMIVLKHKNKKIKENEVVDTDKNEWLKVYEHLFGGFEDLGEDESLSEEEDIPDELKTKHGYLKDGFVVSSSDVEDDEEYLPEEGDDDNSSDLIEEQDDDDEEAEYGGNTEDEMEAQFEEDDDDQLDDDDDQLDDDEPASELSEEEYSY